MTIIGLQPGDRHKLNTFITDNLEDLRVKYQALSKEEKQILVEELRETRNMRGQVKRTNPKAATRDVNATCNAMIQEVSCFIYFHYIDTSIILISCSFMQ